MVIMLWPPVQYRGATSMFDAFFNAWLRPCPCPCNHDYCWFYFVNQDRQDSVILGFWRARKVDSATQIFVHSILIDKNCWFCFFNDQKSLLARIVDSGLLNDQKCRFYSNTESTFWTPHDIQEMHNAHAHFVVSLLIGNNKIGHQINKMGIHFNKVGHINSKVGHGNN